MKGNRYGIKKIDIRDSLSSEVDFRNCIGTYHRYTNIVTYIVTQRVIKGKSFGIRIIKMIYGRE